MDTDLTEFLNFSDNDEQSLKISEVKESLHCRLRANERKVDVSGMLFTNISLMTKRIQLTAIQQKILALVVLKQRYEPLKGCFDRLHTPSEMHLYAGLAMMMESDASTVAKAMAGGAALRASGLIKIDDNYRSGLDLEPMDGLIEALMSENENEEALLRHFLVPAKAATLQASDYPHVQDDFVLLRDMLKASTKQQEAGVNILIYGTPGSGKTELARLLAQSIGVNLFEVKTEDDDG
ncbi:MAG: AAA family ATPase, partial [Mariprofundus sp.]|nr:AAA family ATPase [Mariprofundus sp.]